MRVCTRVHARVCMRAHQAGGAFFKTQKVKFFTRPTRAGGVSGVSVVCRGWAVVCRGWAAVGWGKVGTTTFRILL